MFVCLVTRTLFTTGTPVNAKLKRWVKKLHCLSFTPFPCLMFCPSFLRF